jgi:hypothetical protein
MKIGLPIAFLCLCAISHHSADCLAQTTPPRDQWGERFNTKDARLTYKELGRSSANGRTVVTYNLFASGLPKARHWILWVLNVGREPQAAADAYINDEGKVVNVLADSQHQVAEDPIDVKVVGGKGEPVQFALISDDDRFRVFALIVPFPMEASAGPCHLSAIQTGPYYSGVSIKVNGLHANEELVINQQSEGESAQTKAKADDQGNYNVLMLPVVKGKRSGKARFNIEANSCKIGIEFRWGDGSYKLQ